MPAPPKRDDPRPEQRRDQLEHGAQSDQGDKPYRPLSSREKDEPAVWEGGEGSDQQRRA